MPAIARVVVVSWNGAHLLPDCLDSLEAQTVRDRLEVVVVDNASTDGTADLLATRYPAVWVVTSSENLGFAGGAALGMDDATTDVVLLNNDARFAPDAVERLLGALHAPGAERVGAVTALVVLDEPASPRVRVNSTGGVLTADGAGGDRDWLVPLGEQSCEPEVFGFTGGAAALRREALDEVGGFDPWLFLYYEDTDLSWRMRAAGWTVRYVEGAVAFHRHAASSRADSPVFRSYNTRNSLVVVARHAPTAMVLRAYGRQTLGLVRALVRRDVTAGARARGLRDAVARLPTTLHERRELWRGVRISRRDVIAASRRSP